MVGMSILVLIFLLCFSFGVIYPVCSIVITKLVNPDITVREILKNL